MNVLSTKILTPSQRNLLLHSDVNLVMYNAIKISFLHFSTPKSIKNAIFSSQNGVESTFLDKREKLSITDCFCIGNKTKALLEEKGQKVTKMAQNSEELGSFIAKNYKNESFYYFCGTKRRDELPTIVKASNNELFEVKTYKTTLNPKKFEQNWGVILFFSPSGVRSFTSVNAIGNATAICIGDTTANEAKKHTQNCIIANTTSIESVIAKTVKTVKTA